MGREWLTRKEMAGTNPPTPAFSLPKEHWGAQVSRDRVAFYLEKACTAPTEQIKAHWLSVAEAWRQAEAHRRAAAEETKRASSKVKLKVIKSSG